MDAPLSLRRRHLLAALAGTTVLGGCADLGEDRTKARVRFLNAADAAGYPALDLRVEGTVRQGSVAYGDDSPYIDIAPDEADCTISNAGSPTALLTFTPTLSRDVHYALLAFGGTGALRQLLVAENVAEPLAGHSSLRILNAAPDAGSLDVYITAAADRIETSVPARAAAAYGELSSALDLTSGTWRVRVTAAGSQTDLRLDVPDVAFGHREALVLVLTPSRGGAMVNALLLRQGGAVARLDGTQARVRVAAGVTASGAVTASHGTTVLMSAIGSPAVSEYAVVAAGAPTFNVSVNGNSVGAPATALVAGGDYTLLVYGDVGTPQAALVEDDNRLPTVTTRAKVRLVNGVAGLANPLSMTVNALPVASNVAVGTASTPYVAVTATEVGLISVTSAGLVTPVYSAANQVLEAGKVYTIFVTGAAGAVAGTRSEDN